MMRYALVLAVLGWAAAVQPSAAAPVLERVVVLERHGVRSPTQPPADLAPYAAQPWAPWPVAPGLLTDHGQAAIARMGEALRARYAALLPGRDCAARSRLYVWADNADQRTRVSGQTMAEALAPGCGVTAGFAKDGRDPLFHADGGICRVDRKQAQAMLEARLGPLLTAHRAAYDRARRTLAFVLNPSLKAADCANDTSKKCTMFADDSRIEKGRLRGTLADGATLSENLYLEYAEGMPHPGWGRLNAKNLGAIMVLHSLSSDLMRATPGLAARNGTLIARQIESVLTDVPAFPHQAAVPADARFVLLLGHDTNLANIAGMLGIGWTLPGEPDVTAPDTALAFELWHGDDGARFVRVRLYYQTVEQLRHLTQLGRPPHRDLALPGCTKDRCALPEAIAALERHMAWDCLTP